VTGSDAPFGRFVVFTFIRPAALERTTKRKVRQRSKDTYVLGVHQAPSSAAAAHVELELALEEKEEKVRGGRGGTATHL